MAYRGTATPIPLGQLGLRTDDPMTSLPPNALIAANNVSFYQGRIEKARGTTKYNDETLGDPIVAVYDWWPTSADQRMIAVTSSGDVYRDTGDTTFNNQTPIGTIGSSDTLTTDTHVVAGGNEEAGKNRKLFILSGVDQIKVIDGDGSTIADISGPSLDWATSDFPTFGIIYQGRLCVMNSAADRHRLYFSNVDDHEDFTTNNPPTFSIFPGEFDGIKCAAVYRGLLFIFKEPFGVYILDGRDPLPSNWTTIRYTDAFGVASPHSLLQVLSDLIAANSSGSYTSLQASDAYGDFEAGDILANNLIESYIRSTFNDVGIPFSQAIYYPEKKVAMFSGQSTSSSGRNQMLVMDVGRPQLRPSIDTKERPNCLSLRRDAQKIQRPMYGAIDGHVYLMDQNTFSRDGQPYIGEFQTAYTDFSFASTELSGKNKIFDFLEVNYVPTGNNSFFCDVYIDGSFRQTLTFEQRYGSELGSFVLGTDVLVGAASGARNRKPLLSCTGNRISFRFYNNNADEAFIIERIIVSFRLSGEQLYSSQT